MSQEPFYVQFENQRRESVSSEVYEDKHGEVPFFELSPKLFQIIRGTNGISESEIKDIFSENKDCESEITNKGELKIYSCDKKYFLESISENSK